MIVRHRILEKFNSYRFNIPYHSGDKVLVGQGQDIKKGMDILRRMGSNIKYSFYLPDQIGVDLKGIVEYINCIDGEYVSKGDVLAEKVIAGGLNVKKIISPSQGVVDLSRIKSGFLDLLGEESEVLMKSTFRGTVESISLVDGITIVADTYALDLLHVSDMILEKKNSKKLVGEFVVLGEGKDLLLHADDSRYEDKIVFVGKYLHPVLLHDLFEKGALFVLTYSMDYEDFRKQGLPVGVVGGFGEIYCGRNILDLITSMNGKFAVVDYEESQLFFVTDESSYKSKEGLFVKSAIGSTVISRSLSNYGMLGKIVEIEEDSLYVTVEWEGGPKSMLNIGSVEFVSF